MADKKVRMTVEFSIDDEALQEHGVSAEYIFKHLVFDNNYKHVKDGFGIHADVPGIASPSVRFLHSASLVSKQILPEWSKDDGLDRWRRMVIDEIDVNGDVYELSPNEKDVLSDSLVVIDWLAKRMDMYMQNSERNEYDALELAFDEYFEGMIEELREHGMEHLENVIQMIDGLGISREAKVRGDILYIEDVEVFLGDDGELLCLLPGEDEPSVMRDDIRDIEAGDAFFRLNTGMICFAQEDAHQNFDEPDEPWIISDDSWGGFFEEDIGTELHNKVRALLEYHATDKNKGSFEAKLGEAKKRSKVSSDTLNVREDSDITLS